MGFTYKDAAYYYTKNAQGDVTGIVDSDLNTVVEYSYDAWGKLLTTTGSKADTIGKLNPFLYRGYYYDADTRLYYLNSRYYDVQTGRFLNADDTDILLEDQENLTEHNLFAYCLNNPVNMADDDGGIAWWIAAAVGGAAFDTAAYIIGATVSGQKVTWAGVGKAALAGAVTGVTFGAIGKIAKSLKIVTAAVKTNKSVKMAAKAACFVAGTLIATEDGFKPIEDIRKGDYVYSENPETGEKELKSVVQTFVNKTSELIHVFVNGEEIVTTPEHPFYVPQQGWTAAINLRAGDVLVLSNGEYVTIEKIQHELLEKPIVVYNFEVEDFHTYYVGENGILVHNTCSPNGAYQKASYHNKGNALKSAAPKNGQAALNNSVLIKGTTTRRVGISNNQFVVLDETSSGIFHGHVRSWGELTPAMQSALKKAGLVNKRGKIL
ncbi:polymorphic toxin-type HINT domain-containing protein [Faecalispora jeddahensis]|uniref:polymorphic toxin-type HINT domain-containing protein n=1 Tax=Faecalispora jeddahensis TaxID=1414721 RepID=UPI00145B698E|nr:polymorphic toxin-type HINT domain-containing protein [Faecalispora jeddahensis]